MTVIVFCALQGLAMSMADPDALPVVHARNGIKSSSLLPITTWFNGAFRQLSKNEAAQKVRIDGELLHNP